MNRERPVVFRTEEGECLFGVVHEPDAPLEPRVGVNLLNPGLKNRVAPNRLNVVLARRLAARGYFVLRFDPPGIGDSGGELPEELLPDLWQWVQRGGFVGATATANDRFAEEYALEEIVGAGNCGGAITALLAASADSRTRRLVLLDLPVTLRDRDLANQKQIRGSRHGKKILRGYIRRMRDPRAWLRLLTFRSDTNVIRQALRARFLDPLRPTSSGSPRKGQVAAVESNGESLSRPFLLAMEQFHARGGTALFVNAGGYDNTFVFDRLFADWYLAVGTDGAKRHRRLVVERANHVYGLPEWRESVWDALDQFLAETSEPTSMESPLDVGRST